MKTVTKDVKLKGEVVETIDIPQLENEDDVAEWGLDVVISLANRQKVADDANACRGKYREGEPGKNRRFKAGINCLPLVQFDDGSTGIDKLKEIAGLDTPQAREKALVELIDLPEVQTAIDAALGIKS